MKKLAAVLMAVFMAVPAFALPVCAAACGGAEASGFATCCCGPKIAPTDGKLSLESTPCCPSDAPSADLGQSSPAVGAARTEVAPGPAPAVAGPAFPAAAASDAAAIPGQVILADSGGARSTGPPIFLSVSSLRL